MTPAPRRDFLKRAAAGVALWAVRPWPAMAGPFEAVDFEKLVPADKKLHPEWVKSLFARGTPEVLRGNDLKYVGMPVGGIGAGQLYLGGDGRLWHWDIFNRVENSGTTGPHYAQPLIPGAPLRQVFSLTIGSATRTLDRAGFSEISFRGEYPIGRVDYTDKTSAVAVQLEAFSPFIPLNTDDSSLPATILEYTLRNISAGPVEVTITGELENGVCLNNRWVDGILRNEVIREPGLTILRCSAEKGAADPGRRPDLVFEDWSQASYAGWQTEGTAFGRGPVKQSEIGAYPGAVGGDTAQVVNSQVAAPGATAAEKDRAVGKLRSREFVIERNFITFWITGGKTRPAAAFGLTLFVADHPVQTIAGQEMIGTMRQHLDVRAFAGKTARIEIVDDDAGSWGHIGVGKIVFTDHAAEAGPLEQQPDFGTMALALRGAGEDQASPDAQARFDGQLIGSLSRTLRLAPGATATVTFVLAWHFPNLSLPKLGRVGRHYANRFASAPAVARYVATEYERLAGDTRRWRDTWQDSTLPGWLLDRTFLNTSILATSTCFRLANGRFYGWEGVGCCAGTCGHVYLYAQAAARLFPELERSTRELVDLGRALQPDGAVFFRGELNAIPAIDAQAGTVLRAFREHQMSADAAFLQRNWPKLKRVTQWLITQDGNQDGIIEGKQHNTLDTDWFGPVAWLSGLYLAALQAAAMMGEEVGDADFARQCRALATTGQKNLVTQLFDGEYFINRVDPKHLAAVNSGTGCEIDQVFGQSWAFQVGLPRVLPAQETRSALQSLWRYNFSPDVGPYREVNKPGRWYAMAGEAGLLMCTFPRRDWDYERAKGEGQAAWAAMYFNECMAGFEHQVAGHMIWEGLLLEGLAVERAVHDRYHAARRNPWNEIECGDHYARSMASYGVYLAACGYEYDGPRGHIGFAPRLTPEHFRGAFTAAEGWGAFSQKQGAGRLEAEVMLQWGQLRLQTLALVLPTGLLSPRVTLTLGADPLAATLRVADSRVEIHFAHALTMLRGQTLKITLA